MHCQGSQVKRNIINIILGIHTTYVLSRQTHECTTTYSSMCVIFSRHSESFNLEQRPICVYLIQTNIMVLNETFANFLERFIQQILLLPLEVLYLIFKTNQFPTKCAFPNLYSRRFNFLPEYRVVVIMLNLRSSRNVGQNSTFFQTKKLKEF